MQDPKSDATISRRRFLEGLGTTAAGVAAVAALGPRFGTSAPAFELRTKANDTGMFTLPSQPSHDVPSAGSYIAQQRGKVPLSSRGSRATTLR
jgi:hypothetical protein